MKLLRASLATTAAAVMLVGMTSVPAHAASERIGVRVSDANGSCGNGENAVNTHVKVCFDPHADKLYVKDENIDGRSAYGYFDSGWHGEQDVCRNPYGAGTWVMCDYDLTEYIKAKFQGYTRDNEGTFNFKEDYTAWAYECTTLGGC